MLTENKTHRWRLAIFILFNSHINDSCTLYNDIITMKSNVCFSTNNDSADKIRVK